MTGPGCANVTCRLRHRNVIILREHNFAPRSGRDHSEDIFHPQINNSAMTAQEIAIPFRCMRLARAQTRPMLLLRPLLGAYWNFPSTVTKVASLTVSFTSSMTLRASCVTWFRLHWFFSQAYFPDCIRRSSGGGKVDILRRKRRTCSCKAHSSSLDVFMTS
jgi:hypothetical protein